MHEASAQWHAVRLDPPNSLRYLQTENRLAFVRGRIHDHMYLLANETSDLALGIQYKPGAPSVWTLEMAASPMWTLASLALLMPTVLRLY